MIRSPRLSFLAFFALALLLVGRSHSALANEDFGDSINAQDISEISSVNSTFSDYYGQDDDSNDEAAQLLQSAPGDDTRAKAMNDELQGLDQFKSFEDVDKSAAQQATMSDAPKTL